MAYDERMLEEHERGWHRFTHFVTAAAVALAVLAALLGIFLL